MFRLGDPSQARDVGIKLAWSEPAQLDDPPDVIAGLVDDVPAIDEQDSVPASRQGDERAKRGSGCGVPDLDGAVA